MTADRSVETYQNLDENASSQSSQALSLLHGGGVNVIGVASAWVSSTSVMITSFSFPSIGGIVKGPVCHK
jgi:hypothetical protein